MQRGFKIISAKCEYPGCKKEGKYKQVFELINEEGANVELSFCDYHFHIVMGGHFKAIITKRHQNLVGEMIDCSFELIGPLKEIEIAEQVIAAREMIAKLKSNDKSLKS